MYWMCVIYKSDVCTNSFSKSTDNVISRISSEYPYFFDACDVSFGEHSLKTRIPTYGGVPMSP